MPKFDARRVESIDYDFTAFPRYDADAGAWIDDEKCTAKGTVPEPTDASIVAFFAAVDVINADVATGKMDHAKSREKMTEILVEHLRIPAEHVNELGPRHFNEFRNYVSLALTNDA